MRCRFVQFRRVFRLVFPVVVRFVQLPVVRRARHSKYIYTLVALIRLYMYICASARVIKHSSFKAKKRVWKERVVLFWRRNFFFSLFFLFGLLSHKTDKIFHFFWIKNLSQINTNKGVFFFSSLEVLLRR